MKNAAIIAMLAMSAACINPCLGDAPADPAASLQQSEQSASMLQGQVDALAILTDQVQSDVGFECTKSGGVDVKVSKVKPGSEADNKGLHEGDVIQNARVEPNVVVLNIKRDKQVFTLELKYKPAPIPPLVAMQPKLDVSVPKTFPLQASRFETAANKSGFQLMAVTQQKIKPLADYNIELIVDRSKSMRHPDCPGREPRWNWCGDQAQQLARDIAPFVPKGLTITTFAHEHEVYEHSTPQKIVDIFNNTPLQLGTLLNEALSERLNNYFAKRRPGSKPLLIAIVTDGLPAPDPEPLMVKGTLIRATKKMKDPREITVVFLQIGKNPTGNRYLHDLNDNLVSSGARFPIVHTEPFSELVQSGLTQALVEAVKKNQSDARALAQTQSPPVPRRNRTQ
jgi:hypothetical protein